MKVAFLGPEGTYTHQAVIQQFGIEEDVEIIPKKSIAECFEAINSRQVDYTVVPFENSTNGQVVFTYDLFRDWFFDSTKECRFRIVGEQFVPIHHNLLGYGSVQEIETIYSHPQIASQNRDNKRIAAISSKMSAKLYDLPIIVKGIEDNASNTTRFLVLGYNNPPKHNDVTEGKAKAKEEEEKITSLMFTLPDDSPGALCDILFKFKQAEINLTSINSRPANLQPWQYVFFVEAASEINTSVLKSLQESCLALVVLGTFDRNKC
ncbi:PHA2 [Candida oxycetoniae]|uniref:PHA2 n=1 Tax=Candida oxycetoniae TaxID=497107 RepID=A0AAI9WZ82_9ASCO|nr:PHA2 [Candida oxycetoniae]KAI3405635.2 PHA2 [Candida oxycetoniae]